MASHLKDERDEINKCNLQEDNNFSNHSFSFVRYNEKFYISSDEYLKEDKDNILDNILNGINKNIQLDKERFIQRIIPGILIYSKVET